MAYNIIVAPRALLDLDEAADYVRVALYAPDASHAFVSHVLDAIGRLEEFPFSGAKVKLSCMPDYAVRRLVVDEFLVFYRVDEPQGVVYVLRIRYGRTDYMQHLNLE